ncbi:hypothetical protein KAU15_04430, partial [candidate division WOR-3 bacterium]|nr:hypothetical protein [candidate division WOR-3 bacterium]
YLAEYNSGLINFGIISASTALKRIYLSTLYRDVWFERDNEDADYLAKTGSSLGAEVQNIITVNMNYSRYLKTNIKVSFADSLTSKILNLKTDSIFGIRTGFTRRRDSYGERSIYELDNYKIGKRIFMFLPEYVYETEYRNATDYIRHKGILGLSNYFTISYINEKQYLENDLKKTDAFDFKTSFSFFRTNANINGQYRHTEDNSQIKNNLFMRLNINGIIIPQWTYSQNLLLTSVSNYMISESYIYAGIGKGDYVYDTLSGNYVFDEFEGEYIKITENVISNTPVAKREYGIKMDFFTNSINAFSQIRYSDNALTVGSFNSEYIYNKNIYEFTHCEYRMTNGLSPFIEHQYLSNNQMENSEMITQMIKGGINKIGGNVFYSISSSYSNELNANSFGTNQNYTIKDIGGTATIKETKWIFELMVILRDLLGSYRDNYIEINDIGIKGSTVGIGAKYNIYKALYIRVKPEATFNMYNENYDEIPLTLYYRYPEELSFKGEITIGWHNEYVSLTGRYSSEITEKNGFRQKADISLYTYF